jgi:hypothetical protein
LSAAAAAGQRQERTSSKARWRSSRRPCRQTLRRTPLLGAAATSERREVEPGSTPPGEAGRAAGSRGPTTHVRRQQAARPLPWAWGGAEASGAATRTADTAPTCQADGREEDNEGTQSSERKTGEGDQAGATGRTTLVAMVLLLTFEKNSFQVCPLYLTMSKQVFKSTPSTPQIFPMLRCGKGSNYIKYKTYELYYAKFVKINHWSKYNFNNSPQLKVT